MVTRTMVLTGGRAGQTCTLGKRYRFVNGRLVLRGDGTRIAGIVSLLERQYQAREVGNEEAEHGQRDLPEDPEPNADAPVPAGVQRDGEGPAAVPADVEPADGGAAPGAPGESQRNGRPELPVGTGHQDSRLHAVLVALSRLDHSNDSHWLVDGSPRVSALGIDGLTRRELDRLAPGFRREV